MSAASFVVDERCPTCGCIPYYWTVERICEAAQSWTEENGRTPRAVDWNTSAPYRPTKSRVSEVFGTWNDMLRAAGLPTRPIGGGKSKWTKELVAEAMMDWLFRYGEWPESRDWESRAGKRGHDVPGTCAVIRLFGSWNAAKKFAGWPPDALVGNCSACGCPRNERTPGCGNCRSRHWHRKNAGVVAPPPAASTLRNAWSCVGCGTDDPTNKTDGCKACSNRHSKSRKRAPGSCPEVIPSSRVSGGATLNKPRQRRPLPVATAGADERTVAA